MNSGVGMMVVGGILLFIGTCMGAITSPTMTHGDEEGTGGAIALLIAIGMILAGIVLLFVGGFRTGW